MRISEMELNRSSIPRKLLLLHNMPQAIRWCFPRIHGFPSVLNHVFPAGIFAIVNTQVDGFIEER
jgi:hypothetical protein